jgi:hypothetical protein
MGGTVAITFIIFSSSFHRSAIAELSSSSLYFLELWVNRLVRPNRIPHGVMRIEPIVLESTTSARAKMLHHIPVLGNCSGGRSLGL